MTRRMLDTGRLYIHSRHTNGSNSVKKINGKQEKRTNSHWHKRKEMKIQNICHNNRRCKAVYTIRIEYSSLKTKNVLEENGSAQTTHLTVLKNVRCIDSICVWIDNNKNIIGIIINFIFPSKIKFVFLGLFKYFLFLEFF